MPAAVAEPFAGCAPAAALCVLQAPGSAGWSPGRRPASPILTPLACPNNMLVYAPRADHRSLHWVEGNAEALPFEDNSVDAYTIAFGIRNVTDRDAALREAHRQGRGRVGRWWVRVLVIRLAWEGGASK